MRLLHLSSRLGLATLCLATLAGTVTAKPARPVDGALVPGSGPPALEVVRGDRPVVTHVQANADAIVACSRRGRATFLRVRVTMRWDARSRVQRVNVYGGSAAFNRCTRQVLGRTIAATNRRGSGQATIIVRRPDVVATPTPRPAATDLQSCTRNDDCTIHFQLHACISGDPVAVNQLDPAAVKLEFPVRRLACGMGGPQYQELVMRNANRWSATCEQARCTVHDAGLRPTPFETVKVRPGQ